MYQAVWLKKLQTKNLSFNSVLSALLEETILNNAMQKMLVLTTLCKFSVQYENENTLPNVSIFVTDL
jgi:hypothetical protein